MKQISIKYQCLTQLEAMSNQDKHA